MLKSYLEGSYSLWDLAEPALTNFVMSRRRAVKRAEMYLSPVDVEEFRTVMLDSGTRLASLLVVEYPNAGLVDEAFFGVTDVVECYPEGKMGDVLG